MSQPIRVLKRTRWQRETLRRVLKDDFYGHAGERDK